MGQITVHLQIAFGVCPFSKILKASYLHDYGITCFFNEVLRFKKSVASSIMSSLQSNRLLVQIVVDHFLC